MNRFGPLSILHRLGRVCLCLALAWAGFMTALPCVGNAAFGKMIICGDEGAQVVWLDEDGRASKTPPQTGDCARCPDCLAASVSADLGPRHAMPQPLRGPSENLLVHGGALRPDAPEIPQTARGPPPATRA